MPTLSNSDHTVDQSIDSVLKVPRLRVLREVAATGSIAAAADALWMTPSAVSQQLAALERETGTRLIEKVGRGVRLTEAGRLLADRSESVFLALRKLNASLKAFEMTPSGRLRVSSFASIVRLLLPDVVLALTERFPDLVVEVQDLEGDQSLEELRIGHVDIAIVDDLERDLAGDRESIEMAELCIDPLVVILPRDHELAGRDGVSWGDLAEQPMIAEQRSSDFSRYVDAECRRAGFVPRVRARVHDAAAMLAFIESSGMVAVLPELAVAGLKCDVCWRPLDPPIERRLVVATRTGDSELPAVRSFVAELRRLAPLRLPPAVGRYQ